MRVGSARSECGSEGRNRERERERVGSAQSKCGSEGRNRERGLGLRKVNVAQKEEIEAERVSEGWVCTE